jgi:DNA-binding IclR family transcriptional regulator
MANHLTPEELSKELGIDRQEVIRVCVQLQALGALPHQH